MGIDLKIEEAKEYFKEIQQSGRNNYQKYNYLEVKDIFPIVREVCRKFKMRSKFDWKPEQNIIELTLKDLEDGSTDVSTIPVAPVTMNDAGRYMQDIGRCQTYAQRYLYIQVFEIAVPDEIDSRDQKKMVTKSNQQKSNKVTKKSQPKTEPIKTEPGKEDIKKALDTVYDIIVNQGGSEFTLEKALFQLRRKYKDNPELIRACEESLKTNQADKVNKV